MVYAVKYHVFWHELIEHNLKNKPYRPNGLDFLKITTVGLASRQPCHFQLRHGEPRSGAAISAPWQGVYLWTEYPIKRGLLFKSSATLTRSPRRFALRATLLAMTGARHEIATSLTLLAMTNKAPSLRATQWRGNLHNEAESVYRQNAMTNKAPSLRATQWRGNLSALAGSLFMDRIPDKKRIVI